jgi:hypothetical protein
MIAICLVNVGCQDTPHQKLVGPCDSIYYLNENQMIFLNQFPSDSLKMLKQKIRQDFNTLQNYNNRQSTPFIQGKFDAYFNISDKIESLLTAHQQLLLQINADQKRLSNLRNMLREKNTKDAAGNPVTLDYLNDIFLHESQHLDSVQITVRTQHEEAIRVIQQVQWLSPLVQKSIEEIQINNPF